MRWSLWLIGAASAGLAISLAFTGASNRFAFNSRPAFAQDDNAEYEAEQARQRAEDAQQQERYRQEQEEQQRENAQEQNEYQREQEEQRHQEEMDRPRGDRQGQD